MSQTQLIDFELLSEDSKEQIQNVSEKITAIFSRNISKESVAYLKSRKVTEEDIEKYQWGTVQKINLKKYRSITNILRDINFIDEDFNVNYEGSIIYPIRHRLGYIIGWQARATRYKKYYTLPINSFVPNIYGSDLNKESSTCFVTEGWFDYYAISKSLAINLPVVSTLTANIRDSHIEYLSRYYKKLIFAYDVGFWSTRAGQRVETRLRDSDTQYTIVDLPKIKQIKDWGDIYRVYGESKTGDLLLKLVPDLVD